MVYLKYENIWKSRADILSRGILCGADFSLADNAIDESKLNNLNTFTAHGECCKVTTIIGCRESFDLSLCQISCEKWNDANGRNSFLKIDLFPGDGTEVTSRNDSDDLNISVEGRASLWW